MSNVERIRRQLDSMAHDADTLIYDLYQRHRSALETEQREIKELLGRSDTGVDKNMIAAIDVAVTNVQTARNALSAFSAAAKARKV